jgi:hypothetical protein
VMTVRTENEGNQGLVHRLDFTITEANGLEMRVYGDVAATAKARAR